MSSSGAPNRGLVIGLSAGGGGIVLVIVVAWIVVLANQGVGGNAGHGGHSGGGGNERAGLTRKWSVPFPDSANDASTRAAFVTADKTTLVRISGAGITGYDLSTGKPRFSIAVPDGDHVCAGTGSAPVGIAALVIGPVGSCTSVVAIDVDAGKRLWTTDSKVGFLPTHADVTAAGGKFYVNTGQRLIQYDARGGPSAEGSAAPQAIAPKNDLCEFTDVAATAKLVVTTVRCADRWTLIGRSPSPLTRTVFSTRLHVGDGGDVTLVSMSPLHIVETNEETNRGELRLFDDEGVQTRVISSRRPQGTLDLGNAVVVGATLVAAVHTGEDAPDRVAGIDLQTGRWAWSRNLGSTFGFTLTDSADDPTKVFALVDGGDPFATRRVPPHSYLIDPAKRGAVTRADTLDADGQVFYLPELTTVMSANGEIILLADRPGDGRPLIAAYGR